MEALTYETVARFALVSSLLLFIALFIAVLVYVFGIASSDRLDAAQRSALDLGPENRTHGGRV